MVKYNVKGLVKEIKKYYISHKNQLAPKFN